MRGREAFRRGGRDLEKDIALELARSEEEEGKISFGDSRGRSLTHKRVSLARGLIVQEPRKSPEMLRGTE